MPVKVFQATHPDMIVGLDKEAPQPPGGWEAAAWPAIPRVECAA